MWVISDGSACRLRSFIKKNRSGLTKVDELNATPLHHAAEGGQIELMQLIIDDSSCEVLNVMDSSGNTPLHWATKKNQVESVRLLLSRGANPNILNSNMMAPLHMAVQSLHNEIVKILVQHSSTDVNLEGEAGNTPIIVACYKDNPEALTLLVGEELGHSAKTHINFTNNGKCSPLHLAVQSGDLEMIKMCIEFGAQIDLKQNEKCTALHFAATQGATEIVKLMMSSYAGEESIIDAVDGNKETLLHRQGVALSVNNLLSLNVSIYSKSRDKKSPLHFAASYGRINTCQRLIRDMKDTRLLNEGDKKGMTPLHLAAQNGHEKIEYNFRYLQCPLTLNKKFKDDEDIFYEPLTTLNAMVRHNRMELLSHPDSYFTRVCMCLVLIMSLLGICKEIFQLIQQQTYSTPLLSVMKTFAMMLGDINYHDAFLDPLLSNELPYPFLSYTVLIIFTLLIPILLMNLLIGLAVGDIAEVQKYAALKRIAMQVNLHTNLEKKLPFWFLSRVDQESITVYPNRPRYCGFMSVFQYCFGCEDSTTYAQSPDTTLELEVLKQKYRLKDISTLLEKQHDLIKLIIQKMEIVSEAEDEDSNDLFQHKFRKRQLEHKNSKIEKGGAALLQGQAWYETVKQGENILRFAFFSFSALLTLDEAPGYPVSLAPAQSSDTHHRALLCSQGASDSNVHPQKVKAGSMESNLPLVQVQQGWLLTFILDSEESVSISKSAARSHQWLCLASFPSFLLGLSSCPLRDAHSPLDISPALPSPPAPKDTVPSRISQVKHREVLTSAVTSRHYYHEINSGSGDCLSRLLCLDISLVRDEKIRNKFTNN
ncbi:hypothetical protein IHE44_0001063 [Lamprotornis superbus]|uniref:Ion transport domain-containing protein n=1 Tax=Lamprotornis superbus TaxID=245042 RepID=A0A835TUQ8_9PASS|nr:hypothetical protein IHE44_0001063 [Lamprotornis superbus]